MTVYAGTDGADTLVATAYADVLSGAAGDDQLSAAKDGSVFAVTFEGGTGDDTLTGSYGGDTYVFNRGDGHDVITDDVRMLGNANVTDYFVAHSDAPTYQDVLAFGAGIAPSDVMASRAGNDLKLIVNGGVVDDIVVRGWFDAGPYTQVESIRFDDGTTWGAARFMQMFDPQHAGVTASPDHYFTGSIYPDRIVVSNVGLKIDGNAGDDVITTAVNSGFFGEDITGGPGNDVITGSYAGDTFRFHRGDGADTINDDVRFLGSKGVDDFFYAHSDAPTYQDRLVLDDISIWDTRPTRVGNDLLLSVVGTDDSIRITNFFDGTIYSQIEIFQFSDNTRTSGDMYAWATSDYWATTGLHVSTATTVTGSQLPDALVATARYAELNGRGGNDDMRAAIGPDIFNVTFHGGPGQDQIHGSYGGDTYIFNRGDGQDSIFDDVRTLGNQDVVDYALAHPQDPNYQDVLQFGPGITAADVNLQRWPGTNDLYIELGWTAEGIFVRNFFESPQLIGIDVIAFADGTRKNLADFGIPS